MPPILPRAARAKRTATPELIDANLPEETRRVQVGRATNDLDRLVAALLRRGYSESDLASAKAEVGIPQKCTPSEEGDEEGVHFIAPSEAQETSTEGKAEPEWDEQRPERLWFIPGGAGGVIDASKPACLEAIRLEAIKGECYAKTVARVGDLAVICWRKSARGSKRFPLGIERAGFRLGLSRFQTRRLFEELCRQGIIKRVYVGRKLAKVVNRKMKSMVSEWIWTGPKEVAEQPAEE